MRLAFIETLCELAEQDKNIWLLTGDLGYTVLERFAERFPDRYINMGVAEQNMMGVAAGLALCGKVVFTYSIANFSTMRCLEQIRNDVCYHNLNVKIVAVGGGLAYGAAGYTHHAVEDFAVMRAMPNMTVVAPGDPVEVRLATRAIVDWPGPCYLRLGKGGESVVHQSLPNFQVGKATLVREGTDITVISTGAMLQTGVESADRLAEQGILARVLSMHTLYPLDKAAILQALRDTGKIITVEEHSLGGLGSAVAEVLAEAGQPMQFIPISLKRDRVAITGSQIALRSLHGLSLDNIVDSINSLF